MADLPSFHTRVRIPPPALTKRRLMTFLKMGASAVDVVCGQRKASLDALKSSRWRALGRDKGESQNTGA